MLQMWWSKNKTWLEWGAYNKMPFNSKSSSGTCFSFLRKQKKTNKVTVLSAVARWPNKNNCIQLRGRMFCTEEREKKRRKKNQVKMPNVRRFSCSIFGIGLLFFFFSRAPTYCQPCAYFKRARVHVIFFRLVYSCMFCSFQFKIDDNWIVEFSL